MKREHIIICRGCLITQSAVYHSNPQHIFHFTYPAEYLITTGLTLINYYTGISCNCFSGDKQQIWIELAKFSWVLLTGSSHFTSLLFLYFSYLQMTFTGRHCEKVALFEIKLR